MGKGSGRLAGLALLAGLFSTACSTTVDGITMLSTRNVDMNTQHEPAGGRVAKTERRLWLLFIPLGGAPDVKQVTTEMLEESKGDYLRNVRVDYGGFSLIALSYGWVEVSGDPWRARGVGANGEITPQVAPLTPAPPVP